VLVELWGLSRLGHRKSKKGVGYRRGGGSTSDMDCGRGCGGKMRDGKGVWLILVKEQRE
jgi:hypothetical protein